MGQPVENGCREVFVAEHLRPVSEFKVRRHDRVHPFIVGVGELERQLAALCDQGHGSDLIENEQVYLRRPVDNLSWQVGSPDRVYAASAPGVPACLVRVLSSCSPPRCAYYVTLPKGKPALI